MKKYLFILLFTHLLFAQNEPQLEWAKVQPNSEVGGTVAMVSGAKDSSGNMYFVGNFQNTVDFDTSSNSLKLTSISSSDLFISKYNSDGDLIWAKNVGGLGTITARTIKISGTSLYVTGSFTGSIDFDSSANSTIQTSNGESDGFMVAYTLDGSYSIVKSIGGTGFDEVFDVTFFNNEIIVVGSFSDSVDFDSSASTFELIASGLFTDMFVSKYNTSLEFVSAFKIGGASSDSATSVAIDPTGNLLITGLFRETVDFDPSANMTNLTSTTTDASNTFIVKYSNSGNFIWVKDIGARSSIGTVQRLVLDSANAILVCGTFNRSSDFNPSTSTFTLNAISLNGYDAFVAKYDLNGNYVWAKGFGISGGFYSCNSVVTDSNNNVYITRENRTSSQSTGVITKYSASGTSIFTFSTGTKASNIILDEAANSVFVSGNFINNADFNPSTSTNYLYAEIDNGFIAKYTLDGNYTFSRNIGNISSNNNFNLISTDGNGNVYRAGNLGSTLDLDPSSNTAIFSSSGWTDFYIAKYTSNGDYIWGKTIEGLNFNGVSMMNTDANGNTYVIGRFFGTVDFDPSSNTANLTSTSTTTARDAFIAKYDTDGNFVWVQKIDAISPIDSIQFDGDGNFYFTGRFSGIVDFDPSPTAFFLVAGVTNAADIFFVKFNPQGQLIWAKSLRTTTDGTISIPYRLYVKSNNIYLVGIFGGSLDFDPSTTQSNVLSADNSPGGFLAKYDLDGNYNFANRFVDSSDLGYNVWGSNVVVDSNNDIYYITLFGGEVDFDPSPTGSTVLTSNNGLTLGISKYSSDGSFIWAKSLQNLDGNSVILNEDIQVFVDSNDTIIICGEISGSFDFDPSTNQTIITSTPATTSTSIRGLFIARYNSDGDLITANKLEGSYNGRLNSAVFTSNQDLLISGSYTGSMDFDVTANSQTVASSSTYYNDRFFAKYHFNTLNSEENNFGDNITVYPNPTSDFLNVYNPFFNEMDVKITDLTGKLLFEGKGDNNSTIDVSNYQHGVYIIELNDSINNTKNICKFIKK